MRSFISIGLFCLLALFSLRAAAQYAVAVSDPSVRPSAYVQHGSSSHDLDWHCGDMTYSRPGYDHQGTDLAIPWTQVGVSYAHVPVHAGVRGTVMASYGDCDDVCQTGDCICANAQGTGNYVKLSDRFGRIRIFMHMRRGSLKVKNGDAVEPDTLIGEIGSSGYSTGPHLHDEVRESDDNYIETFAGSCASSDAYLQQVSLWTAQGDYRSVPAGPPYACATEPGRYADGYHDVTSRRAFQQGYGFVGYGQTATLGCPQTPDGVTSFVHSVGLVEIQDFVQDDTSRRFAGSDDGHTALVRHPGATRAYLLHSGFWGTYKCLPATVSNGQTSGSMGGPTWLGAPTDNEHKPTATECSDCANDPVASRQNFEQGYMSYRSDGVIRIHLNSQSIDVESELARAASACGADLDVQGNPPTAPQACTSDGHPQLTFDWIVPSDLSVTSATVWGYSMHPDTTWSQLCQMGQAASVSHLVCTAEFDVGADMRFDIQFQTAQGSGWAFDKSCSSLGGCGGPIGTVTVEQGDANVFYDLIWNGQGPYTPPVYMNGEIDGLKCASTSSPPSGPTDAGVPTPAPVDAGTPTPTPIPTDAGPGYLVIRWDPSSFYSATGLTASVLSWTNGGSQQSCSMYPLANGMFECQMPATTGESLLFTIEYQGASVPGGLGYVFDQSASSTGGCKNLSPGCGQNVGSVTVMKDSFTVPYVLQWNGYGPSQPAEYFNAKIPSVP